MDHQIFVERILENESLTGDLEDEPAARLLQWGTGQVSALVHELDSEELAGAKVNALMALMRQVNRTASRCAGTAPDDLAKDLAHLMEGHAQAFGNALPATAAELKEAAAGRGVATRRGCVISNRLAQRKKRLKEKTMAIASAPVNAVLWRRRLAAGLLMVALLLPALACGGPANDTTPERPPTATVPSGSDGGQMPAWLSVYFTNPGPPDDVAHGIDRYVVEAMNQARETIDVTSFDLNLPSGVQALVDASQRGVRVRVIVDGVNGQQELDAKRTPDGTDLKALEVLQDAGIDVVNGGRSNGLMHNKSIIVDGEVLFMGSWNLSYNDTFRNNNNLLQITSQKLIANYQAKFDEGYEQQAFGTHAIVGAQNPQLMLDGVPVENYFSPVDGVMDRLIAYVQNAKRTIHFMAFTYTDKNLAAAMIDRAQAGVEVDGVIENRGASQGAMVPLFCARLPVEVDGNKYTMHHKVIILDGETVITGSYNFTKSADDANDDNVLVIHSAAVAALYEQEYGRVKSLAATPDNIDCSK